MSKCATRYHGTTVGGIDGTTAIGPIVTEGAVRDRGAATTTVIVDKEPTAVPPPIIASGDGEALQEGRCIRAGTGDNDCTVLLVVGELDIVTVEVTTQDCFVLSDITGIRISLTHTRIAALERYATKEHKGH